MTKFEKEAEKILERIIYPLNEDLEAGGSLNVLKVKEKALDQLLQLHIQGVREIETKYRGMFKDKGAVNGEVIMSSHELQGFADWLAEQRQKLEGLQPKE